MPNCVPPLIADKNLRSQKVIFGNYIKAGFFSTLFILTYLPGFSENHFPPFKKLPNG
jgi:hypothetical protein